METDLKNSRKTIRSTSPYSKRIPQHCSLNALDFDDVDRPAGLSGMDKTKFNKSYNNLDDTILESYEHICTPPGSPYTRRRPFTERKTKEKNDDIINWTLNESLSDTDNTIEIDEEETYIAENTFEDHHLPIVMEKRPSVRGLRNRHDHQYQGIRSSRQKRVINKTGERNITVLNLPEKSVRFFKDFVTTLVEERWRYTLTVFSLSFFCSWIIFAILWYIVALAHGDLNFDEKTGKRLGDGSMPCVRGATTFAGFLLLSIETQVSTGYGEKYPTEECPEAIFLMIVQLIVGLIIDGAMIGIVYAKMSRPPRKSGELKFSKKSVICQRDGKLCFVFRICDEKQTHSICTTVQAALIKNKRSLEGEDLGKTQWRLKLENNGNAIILWPTTICHVIDKNSPLYDVSAKDLLEKSFEIIVTLTGNSRSTGQTTQVRSSYLPREIFWGHRFVDLIEYDSVNECYIAHDEHFDSLEEVDTALCSAKRLDEILCEVEDYYKAKPQGFYIENNDSDSDESIPKDFEETIAGPSHKFIVTQVREEDQVETK